MNEMFPTMDPGSPPAFAEVGRGASRPATKNDVLEEAAGIGFGHLLFFLAALCDGFGNGTALPMLSSASLMAAGSSVMAASPVAKRFCVMSQASSAACWLDVATTQSVKPMVVRKTLMRGGSLGLVTTKLVTSVLRKSLAQPLSYQSCSLLGDVHNEARHLPSTAIVIVRTPKTITIRMTQHREHR